MSLRRISSGCRCSSCRMAPEWCYCAGLQKVSFNTKITFIIHYKEKFLPSNTANLLGLISESTNFHIRGAKEVQKLLLSKDHHPLYLYPSEDALVLDEQLVDSIDKPIELIIPDGTWRQARKVKSRYMELENIQCVKLPLNEKSRYFLRKQKTEAGLSTFEASAGALGIIEGAPLYQELMANFDVMMDAFARSNPFKIANFLSNP